MSDKQIGWFIACLVLSPALIPLVLFVLRAAGTIGCGKLC